MPVQNYGAVMQGAADLTAMPANAFLQAQAHKQAQEYRNAMLAQDQQQMAFQQQQGMAQAQQADEEDAEWDQAYAKRDWGTMARIDPQAAKAIYEHENKAQQAPYSLQTQPGPFGSQVVHDGQRFQVIEPPKPTGGAKEQYQALSPDEVKSLGLPAGTVAQRSPDGKLDVVNKPPAQALTPKDASAAQTKLRQIAIARKQLALVREKFGNLKDSYSAGLGGNLIPSVKGKEADAAVNSMRDTLTSLTRVPGIGAMSDFETRLAQAKFPDRGQYETVSQQQIQSIEDLLSGLESGYTDLLGEATAAQPSGGAVRVKTAAEAAKLPPGTAFITPDGQRRVRK
jgi:hypothetical protein